MRIPMLRAALVAALSGVSLSASAAVQLFFEDFEGYTSFPDEIPNNDPVNRGIPRLSEGASEVWYGGRFETPDSNASINSDLAIQKFGGGTNLTHTGRFEDDAGLLFRISTIGYFDVTLSFDWRTFLADTGDRVVVGYRVGSAGFASGCTGEGEAACFQDFRSSAGNLPWYTSEGGTTLSGNWTQLMRATKSDSWQSESFLLPDAVENQSEVVFAFWLDNGEGDYAKLDNVRVMANPVPLPAAVWLLGSALGGLATVARRRR